jgi:hypothetical protein
MRLISIARNYVYGFLKIIICEKKSRVPSMLFHCSEHNNEPLTIAKDCIDRLWFRGVRPLMVAAGPYWQKNLP